MSNNYAYLINYFNGFGNNESVNLAVCSVNLFSFLVISPLLGFFHC